MPSDLHRLTSHPRVVRTGGEKRALRKKTKANQENLVSIHRDNPSYRERVRSRVEFYLVDFLCDGKQHYRARSLFVSFDRFGWHSHQT